MKFPNSATSSAVADGDSMMYELPDTTECSALVSTATHEEAKRLYLKAGFKLKVPHCSSCGKITWRFTSNNERDINDCLEAKVLFRFFGIVMVVSTAEGCYKISSEPNYL